MTKRWVILSFLLEAVKGVPVGGLMIVVAFLHKALSPKGWIIPPGRLVCVCAWTSWKL